MSKTLYAPLQVMKQMIDVQRECGLASLINQGVPPAIIHKARREYDRNTPFGNLLSTIASVCGSYAVEERLSVEEMENIRKWIECMTPESISIWVNSGCFLPTSEDDATDLFDGFNGIACILLGTVTPSKEQLIDTREQFMMPVMYEKWIYDKQVFRPDADFLESLLLTKDVEISRGMIERIPKAFYIDLTRMYPDCSVRGIMVSIDELVDSMIAVNAYVLMKGSGDKILFFSSGFNAVYSEKGLVTARLDKIPDEEWTVVSEEGEVLMDIPKDFARKTATYILFNMLAYLGSKEPDLQPSEHMLQQRKYEHKKKAQKAPISQTQLKSEDLKIWEVGMRYGNAFRAYVKSVSTGDGTPHGTHKSPRPHPVAGHWSHYWTGKGRTNYEARWIEPYFKTGNPDAGSDVIINNLKREA